LAGGFLRASRNSQPVQVRGLIQSQIGPTDFFSEGITISAIQRVAIRNLAADVGLPIQNGEEPAAIQRILERLASLAESAGGEPPLPKRPGTTEILRLQDLTGNEQFVAVYERRDQLASARKEWSVASEAIQKRWPTWQRLETLLAQSDGVPAAVEVALQAEAIRNNRGLLDNPDPVPPLWSRLSAAMRESIKSAHEQLRELRDREVGAMEGASEWGKLDPAERERLIAAYSLEPIPQLEVSTDEALLSSLAASSLTDWEDRIAAVPTRAASVREDAARLIEPDVIRFRPPGATLKTSTDVEVYVNQLKKDLLERVATSPIVIV
jgi:hypothetical protein